MKSWLKSLGFYHLNETSRLLPPCFALDIVDIWVVNHRVEALSLCLILSLSLLFFSVSLSNYLLNNIMVWMPALRHNAQSHHL